MPPLICLHSFYYDDQHRMYNPKEVYVNPAHIVFVEHASKFIRDDSDEQVPASLVGCTNCSFIVAEPPEVIYSKMEMDA